MYKRITDIVFKPILKQYLKFDTTFRYKTLKLKIYSGVFHPQFFFSSQYLAQFIEKLDLTNSSFCEPCTGSGLISLVAYSKGANVCCFDINEKAAKNAMFNFERNFNKDHSQQHFEVFVSKGFQHVPAQSFDIVAINPPYFFKEVQHESQWAWNCGANGEFFVDFFKDLQKYLKPMGLCYMVLADNCEIERIENIANQHQFSLELVEEKKIAWEKNFIFKIQAIHG